MKTLSQPMPHEIEGIEAPCYKFIVRSAGEAVKVLREELGENAKVISVRQVEGGGLTRFLRAPKLEVIAQVGPSGPVPPPKPPQPAERSEAREPEGKPESSEEKFLHILRRAGIDGPMLAALKEHPGWNGIDRRELRPALNETGMLLRGLYQRAEKRRLGNCVAFIGTPGVGKTTALCKRLAADVFLRGKQARVLKLDIDKANPGDGLAVFCEALGVPMLRQGEPVVTEDGGTLYVDLPGISTENAEEAAEIAGLLDNRDVTRVLVLNAAYDVNLMKQAYALGESLQATHVGFTHLDEVPHWGKLWEFLLSPNLQPLFLSFGQNIAGNFTEEVFDTVFAKMFPAIGSEAAQRGFAL